MSKREIAVLICKVLSLYAILMAMETLPQAFEAVAQIGSALTTPSPNTRIFSTGRFGPITPQTAPWILISSLFPFATQVMVALSLWLGATTIAERMVVEYPDDSRLDVHGVDVKGIAFASVGLLLLAQTLPTLMHALISGLWNALFWTAPVISYGYSMLPVVFRALFGLCLVLQWRGIVSLIHAVKNMGKPPITVADDSPPRPSATLGPP